ncbi:MAG: zinc ribbon domain-containing protein [Candidatus Bathyarchaeia archaeon]
MFCSSCGAKNEDNAAFCVNCGGSLGTSAPTTPKTAPAPGQKNAILATILNFLFPGIGYWYWGYRKVVTISPVLLFIIVAIVEYLIWNYLFYSGFISLLISAFFAYDLYVKTTGQRGWIEATK